MSDQRDQSPNPPHHEPKPNSLEDLQKLAYYYVICAFTANPPALTKSSNTMLLQGLKNELKISAETEVTIQNMIKTNTLVQRLIMERCVADLKVNPLKHKHEDRLNIPPAMTQKKKAKLFSSADGSSMPRWRQFPPPSNLKSKEKVTISPETTQKNNSSSDGPSKSGWGKVSPATLIDRCVKIRIPCEDIYIQYLIKDYDSKTEMHLLVSASGKSDFTDPCDWTDLRHIPADDIIWEEGNPEIPTRSCYHKPGEVILHVAGPSHETRQFKEVGKSDDGIPIIRKIDKGKGIMIG